MLIKPCFLGFFGSFSDHAVLLNCTDCSSERKNIAVMIFVLE
jgi:hypothetical protein